jgi:ribosomal protein S18 acetylase RimI-like enzyme
LSAQFEVRRAAPPDAGFIAGIADSVRFRPGEADANRGYLVYIDSPAGYAERLSQTDGAAWLVLDAAGHALGFVLCKLQEGGAWYVDQIGIHPTARGLGIGPALLQAAIGELKPGRMECHIMHAPLRNERSRKFFTSQGWREVAEEEDPPFVWGRYAWEGR